MADFNDRRRLQGRALTAPRLKTTSERILERFRSRPIERPVATTSSFGGGAGGGGGPTPPAAPTLTAPSDASVLVEGEPITLSATSPDGDLTRVDFVLDPSGPGTGGTIIATDSAAPYSQTWTVAGAAGAHTIVARAVRGAFVTDSAPINVTLWTPLTLGAPLSQWWDADHVVNTGGRASTLTARKGVDLAEFGAAGGTIESKWQDGGASLRITTSNRYRSTDAGLLAIASGADKVFEVWHILQPMNITAGCIHAWSEEADASEYDSFDSNTQQWRTIMTDTSAGSVTGNHTTRHGFGVHCLEHRSTGTTRILSVDGVDETPIAADIGAIVPDAFNLFCRVAGGTAAAFANCRWKATFITTGNLSSQDRARLRKWVAWNYKLKFAGLGAVGTVGATRSLVVPMLGQSNVEGRGTVDYVTADTRIVNLTHRGYYDIPADEPISTNTDNVYTSAPHAGLTSAGVRLAERLLELDPTLDEVILVNCGVGSTDAATWATNITASPPNCVNLSNIAKWRITEALKRPNAKIGPVLIYQGENNAQDGTEAPAWQTNWAAICDELNTFFSGKFDKSTHYVVVQLPVAAPTGTFPNWADVRTAIAALDTARADTILIQAPVATAPPGDGLHQDTGADDTQGLRKIAVDAANGWNAAA